MGEAQGEKKGTGSTGMIEQLFEDVGKTLFGKMNLFLSILSHVVAFLFILFGAGMLYGRYVVTKYPHLELLLLAAPFAIALIAHYNKTFALIMFVALILLFVL